jgi:hypothetical protein
MRASRTPAAVLALVLALGCAKKPTGPSPDGGSGSSALLPIPPLFQETAVWCWAAVAEMVLRYYGQPNLNPAGDYQCGIVGTLGGVCAFDCRACIYSIGNAANYVAALQRYPLIAQQFGFFARPLAVRYLPRPLAFAEVQAEIDARRPVIAGISPSGFPQVFSPQHVCLIVGYDESGGAQRLIVNDPFPYGVGPLGPYGDPFLQRGGRLVRPGQYEIAVAGFSALAWTDTILVQ